LDDTVFGIAVLPPDVKLIHSPTTLVAHFIEYRDDRQKPAHPDDAQRIADMHGRLSTSNELTIDSNGATALNGNTNGNLTVILPSAEDGMV
jgi:hypothetical protein